MKRGQVTQFIIAGLVIAIAVILIFLARADFIQELLEKQEIKSIVIPSAIDPVKKYIEDCMNEVPKLAKSTVSLQGGYAEPNNYIGLDITNAALWYDEGKDVSPSLKKIEVEIADVVNKLLPLCIEEYGVEGYDVSVNNVDTTVIINEDNIITQSNVRVYVNYKETNFTIDNKFSNKYDSDLYNIYNVAKTIVDMEVNNPKIIELTTLASFGYNINFFRNNENEIVYMITTDDTNLFWGNKF